MTSNKLLFIAFVPIILLAGIGLFVRIIQYEPLIPEMPKETEKKLQVPIFPEDPIVGDKKAAKTIVAFEDFGCTSCAEQSKILDTLLEKNPKSAKIIWKIMAISRFPQDTTQAGKYGFCANEQGRFDEFKKYAFENAENLTDITLSTIAKEMKLDDKKLQE
jgi:protein-disulfide isomerase